MGGLSNNIEITSAQSCGTLKFLVITRVPCLFVCSFSFLNYLESEAIFSETVPVTAAGGFGLSLPLDEAPGLCWRRRRQLCRRPHRLACCNSLGYWGRHGTHLFRNLYVLYVLYASAWEQLTRNICRGWRAGFGQGNIHRVCLHYTDITSRPPKISAATGRRNIIFTFCVWHHF